MSLDETEAALDALAAGGLRAEATEAWELFERAWPRVIARLDVFLRSLRVSQDLREDCGQAVLFRVWRSRAGYRGDDRSAFLAWMHQICRREHLRLIEARSRGPRTLGDPIGDEDGEVMDLLERHASENDNPTFENAERGDTQRALEECIEGLEAKHREVIEVLYSEDPLTEREAARALERSKSHINVLRREALALLERCLAGKGELSL